MIIRHWHRTLIYVALAVSSVFIHEKLVTAMLLSGVLFCLVTIRYWRTPVSTPPTEKTLTAWIARNEWFFIMPFSLPMLAWVVPLLIGAES